MAPSKIGRSFSAVMHGCFVLHIWQEAAVQTSFAADLSGTFASLYTYNRHSDLVMIVRRCLSVFSAGHTLHTF